MSSDHPNPVNLKSLSIRPRLEIARSDWDNFVDASPQAWLYHTYDMQDAIATWPGKSDLSFALVDETTSGQIMAILPLHRLDRRFIRVFRNCAFESLGAFAYHPRLTSRQISDLTETLMEYILKIARVNLAEEINFMLPPMTPAIRGELCPKVNPLINLGMTNASSQTYIIGLKKSKKEIWDSMESYCRTHIRKAEKSGIIVRQAFSQRDLETYYELHCQTYHRTGVSPHPFQYFQRIWDNFVSSGRAVVFFAEQDGKVLSADNEGAFKGAMSGWTAAGLGGSTSGANNLLHWTAIQWAVDHGFEFYESGEGFPGIRSGKRKGLTDFKKSFGGDLYPFYRGRITLRPTLTHLRNLLQSTK